MKLKTILPICMCGLLPLLTACGGNDGASADSTQTGGSAEETLPTTDEPGER